MATFCRLHSNPSAVHNETKDACSRRASLHREESADFLQQGQHGGGIDPGPTSIELDSNGLAGNSRHGLGDLGGLLRLFVINEQTRGLLRRVYLVA